MSLRGDSGQKMRLKITGLPVGEKIDFSALQSFTKRAYREHAPWTTHRGAEETLTVESGLDHGMITGDIIFALQSPKPERNLRLTGIPVPGTADYVEFSQYGRRLPRPDTDAERKLFCAAGAVMVQLLKSRGVTIAAHLSCVGLIRDRLFDSARLTAQEIEFLRGLEFPVLDESKGMQMIQRILREKTAGNSVGGQIECAVLGLPVGMGGSWFSALQGRLASGAMAIPGINGVEFGPGFASAALRGSQIVDAILPDEIRPRLSGNILGGFAGGKSTGLPLVFRVSVQPEPAIVGEVDTVDWNSGEKVVLMGHSEEDMATRGRHERPFESTDRTVDTEGRHAKADMDIWEDRDEYLDIRTGQTVRMVETGLPTDPCPALSILPCTEAMAACILLDEWMKEDGIHGVF